MTKDDIALLYEYDRWANQRIFEAVSALGAEQFTRDLGGSFRSVRDTLLHVIGGEWIWLAYWKQPPSNEAGVSDLKKRRDLLFDPEAHADVAATQAKWAEVEREQVAFVNGLTDDALVKMIPARSTEISLGHLMQHVSNHSTYHRGQITLMIRQLGAEPLATDFHVFMAERNEKRRAASASDAQAPAANLKEGFQPER